MHSDTLTQKQHNPHPQVVWVPFRTADLAMVSKRVGGRHYFSCVKGLFAKLGTIADKYVIGARGLSDDHKR